MRSLLKFIWLPLFLSTSCTMDAIKNDFPESFTITVENVTPIERLDEAIALEVAQMHGKAPDFNPQAFLLTSGDTEWASQANDLDGDGHVDQIVAAVDFKPNEKKELLVRFAKTGIKPRPYLKRTQAELSIKTGGRFENRKYIGGKFQNVSFLRVPPQHTDHSEYIRYEGPGWESDKVGYRFYLDWRNAHDIFGKKTPAMVLQNIGQDGFDSYHNMCDWGMDVLKVGESLGIGSPGMWQNDKAIRISQTDSVRCDIVLNGPVASLIRTQFFGWKISEKMDILTEELLITAGSRLTRHSLLLDGDAENLCTGIVLLPDAELLQSTGDGLWSYLATFGKQSLAGDQLGMAILFRTRDLIKVARDALNHVVILRPEKGQVAYYSLAAWEQEPGGIKDKESFIRYLQVTSQRLDHPLVIEY